MASGFFIAVFNTNWKFIVLVYNKFPIRIMPLVYK